MAHAPNVLGLKAFRMGLRLKVLASFLHGFMGLDSLVQCVQIKPLEQSKRR